MYMNDNNDTFKKMDLNFDPTQEAKIDLEEKKEELNVNPTQGTLNNTPQEQPTQFVENQQPQPTFVDNTPPKFEEPQTVYKEEINSFNEPINPSINNKNINVEKSMDKTLEFIIQNDPMNADLTVDEKQEQKIQMKKAYKHRKISFFWIFIAILSILFGMEILLSYAKDIKNLIDAVQNDSGLFVPIIWVVVNVFEPLLFGFFIIFSMIKYQKNHKVYIKWWDDTEPLRIKEGIEKEKELNLKHLQRFNALGLHNTYTRMVASNEAEELHNWKDENKFLQKKIEEEEKRRKDLAKEAKQAAKK